VLIVEHTEKVVCVLIHIARIEDNQFVVAALIVLLVIGQEDIRPKVRIHTAYSVQEDVGTIFVILDGDVLDYLVMDILIEGITVGLVG
jgi:hypothetical protein